MLAPPHSLHWLLSRWCWQMLAPPHSLHWLLWRWCWQMLAPPHSLHLDALVLADARAPALLASAPDALVLADARPPALLAFAPFALVLADARPPALLASAPLALVVANEDVYGFPWGSPGNFFVDNEPVKVQHTCPWMPRAPIDHRRKRTGDSQCLAGRIPRRECRAHTPTCAYATIFQCVTTVAQRAATHHKLPRCRTDAGTATGAQPQESLG
jgi:hypothetical protein